MDDNDIEVTEFVTNTNRPQTPIENLQPIPESSFNYQRKRPAHSPADDLREQQRQLHGRIDSMDSTLNQMASAVHQFADLMEGHNITNLDSTTELPQITTDFLGDATPTSDTQELSPQ